MVSRGEIYFVDLNPTKGREQAGRRPVLVVSADAINRQPLVVTVVVGTRAENIPKDYPTNVRLLSKDTGLLFDTVFLCFQIRSLDQSRFLDQQSKQAIPTGRVKADQMRLIDDALRLTLALSIGSKE